MVLVMIHLYILHQWCVCLTHFLRYLIYLEVRTECLNIECFISFGLLSHLRRKHGSYQLYCSKDRKSIHAADDTLKPKFCNMLEIIPAKIEDEEAVNLFLQEHFFSREPLGLRFGIDPIKDTEEWLSKVTKPLLLQKVNK